MENGAQKVLVIDDDTRNIYALCAVLKSRGYTCVSAERAPEGIRLLEEDGLIAVVLLDMMMPGMDGYQTLTAIRNNEKIAAVPVIAVTAQAMPRDKEKCLTAGADHYMPKPVELEDLVNLLKIYVR